MTFFDRVLAKNVFIGELFDWKMFVGRAFVGAVFVETAFVGRLFVESVLVDKVFVNEVFIGEGLVDVPHFCKLTLDTGDVKVTPDGDVALELKRFSVTVVVTRDDITSVPKAGLVEDET